MEKNQCFNVRAFVALGLSASGLGLPITGYANHVCQMEAMNMVRHAWMAAHNSLGLLFVLFALWHAALNRKAFFSHLRGATACAPRIPREAIAAVAVVTLVLFFFVGHAFHIR